MTNAGLDEAQAEIKIAGRNINNLRYADDITLMAVSKEKLKSFLMQTKICIVKAMVFPVVMYGCESWTIKKPNNGCFQTVVLEKTLESPLDCKEIQPVNPKGNQPWIFIGRTDVEAHVATWCEEQTHWKTLWCWERLRAGGEGDNRGWDGWMSSLPQWMWVWANSGM